jgi:hypothetical protein
MSDNKTTWCVKFRGIDIYVKGEYFAAEPAVRYDSDMGGHPGYPEYFEIETIYIENTDVTDIMEDHMEEIEKLVLETINEL